MITYGQIKDNTLKLIDEFSSRGAALPLTKTIDYDLKIQSICNSSILELASTDAKLPKTMNIVHNPIKNSPSDDTSSIQQHLPNDDFSITLTNAKATFFETTGPATIIIEETLDSVVFSTIEVIDVPGTITTFAEYKRLITTTSPLHTVRLRFSGDYLYSFRNYILYDIGWPTENDIQQHRPWFQVNQPDDFIDFDYVEKRDNYDQLSPYLNFIRTPDGKFIWNSYDGPVELIVHYWRKPNLLTFTSNDATNRLLTIDLRDDAALIIPYACAAEVLNSEEKGMGNIYLQQYTEKRMRLIQPRESLPNTISNVYGW